MIKSFKKPFSSKVFIGIAGAFVLVVLVTIVGFDDESKIIEDYLTQEAVNEFLLKENPNLKDVLSSGQTAQVSSLLASFIPLSCSDSDGGIDFDTRGKVTQKWGVNGKESVRRVTDSCMVVSGKLENYFKSLGISDSAIGHFRDSIAGTLREYYCKNDRSFAVTIHKCEFGCSSGVCNLPPGKEKQEPTEGDEAPVLQPPVVPPNDPNPEPIRDLSKLKIAPPPNGGIYLGSYEWTRGDVATFEQAIGRKTMFRYQEFSNRPEIRIDDNGDVQFDVRVANEAWDNGRIVMGRAYEIIPNPEHAKRGFTVDKLLRGEYDRELKKLASQFREFGKPMLFLSGREPVGVGLPYMGGFGVNGDKDTRWAIQNKKGFNEFDPSTYPNAHLYQDLGDPNVSDGVERLVAGHRYYVHFFREQEGLDFITFDGTLGWGVKGNPREAAEGEVDDYIGDGGADIRAHGLRLLESSMTFENNYPGDHYTDWVSINFYALDFYKDSFSDFALEEDFLVPHDAYASALDFTMQQVRKEASGKPVYFLEFGFCDAHKPEYANRSVEKVNIHFDRILERYPEINMMLFWSDHKFFTDLGFDGCLIKPGTKQANALKAKIESNQSRFHSCVYLSDGSKMPNCQ